MELTPAFVVLLQQFLPVFTAPTFLTFAQGGTGWLLSHRHRYSTEVLFAGGNLGNGHWCRCHRFFSHAAWDPEALSLPLAKLVRRVCALAGTVLWASDDTRCRKRGLTLYDAGMHYDPLISSRAKSLVSWGHDWVTLWLHSVHPFWAPSKVCALPSVARRYRHRQGLTKGKNHKTKARRKPAANHRTRPELAVALLSLVATWFPDEAILVRGDSAYGGESVLSPLPSNVQRLSHVHPKGALAAPAPPRLGKRKGAARQKGARLPNREPWAKDTRQAWNTRTFDQFGLQAVLQVKTQLALYDKAGGQRLLTIVLTRDRDGKRPEHMFYCTKRDWQPRQVLSTYAYRWASAGTFANSKQFWAWQIQPTVFPRPSSGPLRWH
jgi:hypothetical protein